MWEGDENENELTVDVATKRSVAWYVWQFDEAGTRGVYGGGPFNVAGIDQVDATQKNKNKLINKQHPPPPQKKRRKTKKKGKILTDATDNVNTNRILQITITRSESPILNIWRHVVRTSDEIVYVLTIIRSRNAVITDFHTELATTNEPKMRISHKHTVHKNKNKKNGRER